ncbi:helix-turn-helix domain-containing protein [Lactobacillus gasseri]|uniref:helix-turn-helix domain-containing protein n=1 Tax=Lactobacillus gasseri TaxID=1596 RepID=UPI0022E0E557|nr:helix-turn-helix transcriptional regulator [Lactobacillus gasseri]
MRLGQKIAELRKKNNLSQEGLAEKMNVSRQAVSKWESEQSVPDIEKIVNLSELFGVTTDYLLKSGEPSFELKNEDINDKDKLPVLSDELVQKYLTTSQKSSKLRALAFALIIFSPVCIFFTQALRYALDTKYFLDKYGDRLTSIISTIGYILFIITVAIAVGLFVYSIMNVREFKQLKKQNFDVRKEKGKLTSTIKTFHKNNDKYVVFTSILAVLSITGPIMENTSLLSGIGPLITRGISLLIFSVALYFFTFYLCQRNYLSILIKHKKHLPIKLHRFFVYGSWIYAFCVLGILYITSRLPYGLFIPLFDPTLFVYLSITVYCLFTYFFIKEKAE